MITAFFFLEPTLRTVVYAAMVAVWGWALTTETSLSETPKRPLPADDATGSYGAEKYSTERDDSGTSPAQG